jgi:hypothetical protein
MLFHRSPAASLKPRARLLLLASIAALVATTFEAHAAPVARSSMANGEQLAVADGTDFGSRKRYRARRNNAAGLAMMGMVAGTIGAVVAAEQRRDAYRRAQYYDPYGYGGGPYAYRAPRVYHQPHVYHQPRYHPRFDPSFSAWHDRLQRIDPQNPNQTLPTGVPRIGW